MSHRLTALLEALAVDSTERTGPRVRDWLLIVALAAILVPEAFLTDWQWPWLRLVVGLIAVVALAWRRVRSLELVAVAFFAEFAFEVALKLRDGDLDTVEVTFAQGIAGIVLIYALCRWAEPRHILVGTTVAIGLAAAGELIVGTPTLEVLAFLIPWVVVAFFALAMRYRGALQRSRAQQARLLERNALARELHDSVAHHISAIAVQAQAAQYVADQNPRATRAAIADIEATANTAIDEMRRMVGVLRSDADFGRDVASSSLQALAAPAGSPAVMIEGDADLSTLSAPVANAVFRIAQESVTNATRHSDGVTFVDIFVQRRPDDVHLEIVNDGSPTTRNSGGGFGMVGMSERVAALGGDLECGPRPASGWRVAATIPLKRPS